MDESRIFWLQKDADRIKSKLATVNTKIRELNCRIAGNKSAMANSKRKVA